MRALALGFAFAIANAPESARAQNASASDLIRGVFGLTPTTVPEDFTRSFLVLAPYATVRAGANDLTSRLGSVVSVTPDGNDYAVGFERGSVIATLHVDAAGKIDGLLFHDEESPADEAALKRFLTVRKIDLAAFSPLVRGLVKLDELEAVRALLAQRNGRFTSVEATPTGYLAHFERAAVPAIVSTDAAGLITLIFFKPPAPLEP